MIKIVSPAPRTAIIEAANGQSRNRLRRLLHQYEKTQSIAYYRNGGLLAVAMMFEWRARRVELAMMFTSEARQFMLPLIRIAHLTLSKIFDNRIVVFAHVSPENNAARRMARLAGFRQSRLKQKSIMVWNGDMSDG